MKWRAPPLQLIETMKPSCLVECRLLFELTVGICAGLLKGRQPQNFVVRNRKFYTLVDSHKLDRAMNLRNIKLDESRMKENPKPCGSLMGFKNKIKEFCNIWASLNDYIESKETRHSSRLLQVIARVPIQFCFWFEVLPHRLIFCYLIFP